MFFILLAVLSEDDRDFVNKIFLKMNVKMYNISFNILKSHYDAEEAVAQTFLKIIDNIERISKLPCPQIEPYCVVILKNETFNIIRSRKKSIPVEGADHFERKNVNSQIEEDYIKNLDKEKLISCVNELSEEDKNLIYLRFVYEMGFGQIGQLLDITEEAAKKRGQRILKKLRLHYKEGEKDE